VTNVIEGANAATIGGGGTNQIADGGDFSTIAGGQANTIEANAQFAAIGGGSSNTVSGDYGIVPGGRQNRAQGSHSLAAGRRAVAQHNGTFVWPMTRMRTSRPLPPAVRGARRQRRAGPGQRSGAGFTRRRTVRWRSGIGPARLRSFTVPWLQTSTLTLRKSIIPTVMATQTPS